MTQSLLVVIHREGLISSVFANMKETKGRRGADGVEYGQVYI
jgi:hypothetical protein